MSSPAPAVTLFQSTPSARRATDVHMDEDPRIHISIHALREEGDRPDRRSVKAQSYFNPRPPRGGRRRVQPHRKQCSHISIHALREEGDVRHDRTYQQGLISIHALREEGDVVVVVVEYVEKLFQSTPSARRATRSTGAWWQSIPYFNPRPPRGGRLTFIDDYMVTILISIHALREEGDFPVLP